MAEIIRMPRLSDTMEEGNIVSWLKKEGESVSPGDVLAEVETDKATMELESFEEGILLHIAVKEGPVPVDGIIAIIGEKGENVKDILASESASKPTADSVETKETVDKEAPSEISKPSKSETSVPTPPTVTSKGDSSITKASPLAKSMATEAGINLSQVSGTGDGGRIIKKDIENFLANGGTKTQSSGTVTNNISLESTSVSYGQQNLSQMRKVIAKRLSESKFTAPHFYLTVEINMDEAKKARAIVNNQIEGKISFNDMIIKACALALKKHPTVNASWHDTYIDIHPEVNIGVAVAIDDGLIVPVVKNADQKSLRYLNQEVRDLATRAKSKKLGLDEMQGNTFTISNLGMFGIDEFTAIINPPDACILAVGSIIQKPIVKDGELAIGNMMKITLSSDHRIVDGAVGALFINSIRQNLENPLMMLV